jgi:hypothetical protein
MASWGSKTAVPAAQVRLCPSPCLYLCLCLCLSRAFTFAFAFACACASTYAYACACVNAMNTHTAGRDDLFARLQELVESEGISNCSRGWDRLVVECSGVTEAYHTVTFV